MPIASITKLMTVLLTVERTKPSDVVTVSARAAGVGESSANLRAGERLTVRELLEAALIQSANDAADALADYVGKGSEEHFVALMNQRARQLGLRDTHYVRPDGLDATGHVSSAHDVTLLARILMHRPLVRQIVRQQRGDDLGRAHAAHLERPALDLPGHLRRQDRPHLGGRLERGRGRAARRR